MRLEIVDTPPKDQRAHYRVIRNRLRSDRRKIPVLHPNIPVTKISWTFGSATTVSGNAISFDFSPVTMAQIIGNVCQFYNVSYTDLISERRHASLVYPRQVVMYLARELTLKSSAAIGRFLGDRDHSTVLHGWKKIKGLVSKDDRMADEIAILIRMIRP